MTHPHEQHKKKRSIPFSEAELVDSLTPLAAHSDTLASPSAEELEYLNTSADGETSRLMPFPTHTAI